MTPPVKKFLILFLPTFFFLVIFSGFYTWLHFYYLHDDYTWYAYEGAKPAVTAVVFAGFSNLGLVIFSLTLSALLSFLGGFLMGRQTVRINKRYFILNGIMLTFFISLLFFGYLLLSLIGLEPVSFIRQRNEIVQQTAVLAICYIIPAIILSFLFYKIRKDSLQENPDQNRLPPDLDNL